MIIGQTTKRGSKVPNAIHKTRYTRIDITPSGISFVRKTKPFSDESGQGSLTYYSIYNGEVITEIELGEVWLDSEIDWVECDERNLAKLKTQTKERIKTLAELADTI